jgi:hypothetical protein
VRKAPRVSYGRAFDSLFWYMKRMSKPSLSRTGKKIGRPPNGAKSVHLRVLPDQCAAIDNWIEKQHDNPSRPEAIRRLVEIGLSAGSVLANAHARDDAASADGLLKPSVDLPDDTRIEDIELPSKIVAVLTKAHLHILTDLRQFTDEKLMRIASLGRQRVAFLRKVLGGGSHQLVELGHSKSAATPRPTAKHGAARAAELAAKAIDRYLDPKAPPGEREVRKQKLVEGPSILREVRKDRPGK